MLNTKVKEVGFFELKKGKYYFICDEDCVLVSGFMRVDSIADNQLSAVFRDEDGDTSVYLAQDCYTYIETPFGKGSLRRVACVLLHRAYLQLKHDFSCFFRKKEVLPAEQNTKLLLDDDSIGKTYLCNEGKEWKVLSTMEGAGVYEGLLWYVCKECVLYGSTWLCTTDGKCNITDRHLVSEVKDGGE